MPKDSNFRYSKVETDDWVKIPREILEALEIHEGMALTVRIRKPRMIVLEPVEEGLE